jgi:hypothetical protein
MHRMAVLGRDEVGAHGGGDFATDRADDEC